MPAHSSHKLQPLDVGCFRALKRFYGKEIEDLMRAHVSHISKEDFLPAFLEAYKNTFTVSNIQGGFRGAGIVPYDPEYVISQLDVTFRTPTPPASSFGLPIPWESKTPNNPIEAQSQSDYMKNRIARHQNSSPTSIHAGLDQIVKGTTKVMHRLALLEGEVEALRKVNETLSRRRRTKKKRLQTGGSLQIQAAKDLQSQKDVDGQLQKESYENSRRIGR
jgi:hypothetical protein